MIDARTEAEARPTIQDVRYDASMWTCATFDPLLPAEGWTHALTTHTEHPWRMDHAAMEAFVGFSRCRAIDDMRVVAFGGEGELNGERTRAEVERTDRQDLSIVYAAEGEMNLTVGGRDVRLTRGMFTLTDSSLPMTLEIPGGFRQIDLIFPKSRVLGLFKFAEEFVGIPFGRDEGLLAFFIDHLDTVQHHLGSLPAHHADAVMRLTLELLATTLGSVDGNRVVTPRDRMLARLKGFIEANLGNPDLDIGEIAERNRINVRYLHKLFADHGTSVGAWVRRRRLEMCCRDFEAPSLANRTLTEIAFRWGFNDMSHFSKTFKRELGVSPREYRDRKKQRAH